MKKISIFLLLTLIVIGLFIGKDVLANQKHSSSKSETPSQFLKNNPLLSYREYDDATTNVREKILYKDLRKVAISKLGKLIEPRVYSGDGEKLNPNAEVFFFSSVLDANNRVKCRYIVVDASNNKMLWAGETEVLKDHKYYRDLKKATNND
ncbi:hypothetical protein IHV10_20090 [Fictibacillus sp. 5RED26]|uniref:hypothetical protein n=1 Tax=Fictibacillus sp. 5RED26 TaxID=2745876 RepID=UPI0018CD8F99|nr:hypothetical protein [Fictibacillus sp. 5RED26]MBH0158687.1 hypothetical protein [Fictibacillus sp. 5RED26]